MKYNEDYLLDVLKQYEEKNGKLPTRRELRATFGITEDPYCRVFGSWDKAKIRYQADKASVNDEFILESAYDEDYLYGDLIKAEQAQEEVDKIYADLNDIKILSLSDIEFPYANIPMINSAVKHALAEGCTEVVLNGDITHQDYFSKHAKHCYVSPEEELKQLTQFVSWLLTKFERVVMVSGNHDRIATRNFHRNVPSMESVKFMINSDLLAIVEEMFRDFNIIYAHNWWLRLKDVVYMHHDSFTILPMRTTINAAKVVMKQGVEASAFIQGHSHKEGSYTENGITYYETGCSCLNQVYYKDRGGMQWQPAYNIVEIRDGKFNFNGSRNYKWS